MKTAEQLGKEFEVLTNDKLKLHSTDKKSLMLNGEPDGRIQIGALMIFIDTDEKVLITQVVS